MDRRLERPEDLRVEIITLLLEVGADPDHKNRYGHGPRDAANKIANGLETPSVEAVRRA